MCCWTLVQPSRAFTFHGSGGYEAAKPWKTLPPQPVCGSATSPDPTAGGFLLRCHLHLFQSSSNPDRNSQARFWLPARALAETRSSRGIIPAQASPERQGQAKEIQIQNSGSGSELCPQGFPQHRLSLRRWHRTTDALIPKSWARFFPDQTKSGYQAQISQIRRFFLTALLTHHSAPKSLRSWLLGNKHWEIKQTQNWDCACTTSVLLRQESYSCTNHPENSQSENLKAPSSVSLAESKVLQDLRSFKSWSHYGQCPGSQLSKTNPIFTSNDTTTALQQQNQFENVVDNSTWINLHVYVPKAHFCHNTYWEQGGF